jgi:hypothetical protein
MHLVLPRQAASIFLACSCSAAKRGSTLGMSKAVLASGSREVGSPALAAAAVTGSALGPGASRVRPWQLPDGVGGWEGAGGGMGQRSMSGRNT